MISDIHLPYIVVLHVVKLDAGDDMIIPFIKIAKDADTAIALAEREILTELKINTLDQTAFVIKVLDVARMSDTLIIQLYNQLVSRAGEMHDPMRRQDMSEYRRYTAGTNLSEN